MFEFNTDPQLFHPCLIRASNPSWNHGRRNRTSVLLEDLQHTMRGWSLTGHRCGLHVAHYIQPFARVVHPFCFLPGLKPFKKHALGLAWRQDTLHSVWSAVR